MRVPSGLNAAESTASVCPSAQPGAAPAAVPQPRRAVTAGGDDARPVRAERRRTDPTRVPVQDCQRLPARASHSRAVPSQLAVTMRVPSGLNAAELTASVCPSSTASGCPSRVPQPRRAVRTGGDDARPVRAERRRVDPPVCPSSTASGCPSASHSRAVPSSLAVTMRVPSGLNAAELTQPVCPSRTASGCPCPSHSRAVPSALAVTMRVPSALNAAEVTAPLCPSSTASGCPCPSHSRAVPSTLAVTMRVPSALNAAESDRIRVPLQHGQRPAPPRPTAAPCRPNWR